MLKKSILALILLLVLFPSSSVAEQIIHIPYGGTYSYLMNITATYNYNIEVQNGPISVCVNSQENCNNGQYLAVDTYFSVIGSIKNSGNNFLNVVNANTISGSVDISFSISYVTPATTAAIATITIIVVIAIVACCCLCCCLCLVALVLFIVYMTVGIGRNIAAPTATKTSTNYNAI